MGRFESSRPLRRWILALVTAVLAGACTTPAALPVAATSPEMAPTTRPTAGAAAYRRMVFDLADESMEGRGPGTPGIDKARDYIVQHFKAAGLKPAFGDAYTQPLEIPLGVHVGTQKLSVTDPQGKPLIEPTAGADFNALGFSASTGFSGPAVFVGYGITNPQRDYDSYAGLGKKGLAGKVAVAFRYEPQHPSGQSRWAPPGRGPSWSRHASLLSKARRAAGHGAVALLLVNPPSQDKDASLHTAARTGYGRVPIAVMHISSGLLARLLRAAGHDDPDALLRRLQTQADAGPDKPLPVAGVVLRGAVKLESRRATSHNVAAVLPGVAPLDREAIVVGGHYDHLGRGEVGSRSDKPGIHYGADDNASGAAGVMLLATQLARRAAQRHRAGPPPVPRRTVIFAAFTGEERGLLGSRHMTAHLDAMGLSPQSVVAMLNLDMIGRLRNDRLIVAGVGSGDRWRELLADATAETGLSLRMGAAGHGPSDQSSFYSRKVPVLHFFTGLHADYHTPRDTPDKINAAGAVRVLGVVRRVVEALWTDPTRITYVAPEPTTTRMAGVPPGGAFLGITPDLGAPEGEAGCAVAMVMPHGPAATAGVIDGDLIVQWAGKPIANAFDLVSVIRGCKPGQTVTLTVRRAGETLTLDVTLGTR